jgi:large subunit ribosomal protein L9
MIPRGGSRILAFLCEEQSFMKVILLQDVKGLGKAGDLKEVANGYARNYLLPRHLAAGAIPSLVANRSQRIAAEQRKLEKQAELNRQLAERLAQITLTFKAKVGRQGRLYGSITSQDVASALQAAEGITVDRRVIDLSEPIRSLGTFSVPVKVATNQEPKITVNVIDEAAPVVAGQESQVTVNVAEEAGQGAVE